MPLVSAEIEPVDGKATEAARDLQRRGFRVLNRNATISVDAPNSLWTDVFGVQFEEQPRRPSAGIPQGGAKSLRPKNSAIRIPSDFQGVIKSIQFIEPPEFFLKRKLFFNGGSRMVRAPRTPRRRSGDEIVYFEAGLVSRTSRSIFEEDVDIASEELAEFAPPPGRASQAAQQLQSLGFTVRHTGTFSISAQGRRSLWERVFKTKVESRQQPVSEAHPELGDVSYFSHVADAPFEIPKRLKGLVEKAYPQRPPIYFESPLPPQVPYHHVRVPSDVSMILRSEMVHKEGVSGDGVLVAMVDTGFYKHRFYRWHGYRYNATLAPDAVDLSSDANGHGTAEAANIFANAPDIDFIGVKMGGNPTLAFKTASDLHPAIMTNSWGYSIQNPPLPNFLKPLHAAVIEAVKERGITVCFSAGNGHWGWPGQMPEVISVGGVYAHETVSGDDFDLEAANYASSFDSNLYPGRHVPDICGLVGMQPRGIYIMLPVPPRSQIDAGLSGAGYPNKDETANDDGWAVISGTSASSPQIAGVCALLKQVQPGLSPELIKSILRASGRDVSVGQSFHNQPAGPGHDGATGAGLVDAYASYHLARSVQIRNVFDMPPPR